MATQNPDKLTQAQANVLYSLYDVSAHEGGTKTLKPRYYPAAEALIRRGFVAKQSDGVFRPLFQITEAGKQFWSSYAPASAKQSDASGRRYNEDKR
jgi:hypothetical protein